MTFEIRDSVTNPVHIANEIAKRAQMDPIEALGLIERKLDRCVEVWGNGIICGYFLVFNDRGVRSFHGYKFVNGLTKMAVRMSKKILEDYDEIYSAHCTKNSQVGKLLKMVGFKEIGRKNGSIIYRRVK
jgi:hypothetical protein